ncbi:Mss4-like protein [Coniochaeta sp. 2T2.1]|nr:Mss4-like protein [Coniochaeta sp. 2T2.1]
MAALQNGRCNCVSITVSLAVTPTQVVRCHCFNCRRAGGPYSINYTVDEKDVTVKDTQGSLKVYHDSDTRSGSTVKRHFCSNCGSPVYSLDVHVPGKLFLKASLFEQVATGTKDVFSDRTIQWEQ